MKYRIDHAPMFSVLVVDLDANEEVAAQPDSMLTMTSGIEIKARMGQQHARSRWWSGFKNVLGGESFFLVEYRSKRDGETITLVPRSYGDILALPLDEAGYYLTRGSYMASIGPCDLQPKYEGIKGLMAKKGLFLLHARGTGVVFCPTYGAIERRDLDAGQHCHVDNRYVVAFSSSMTFQLVKATRSMQDSLLSGEGLINRYTGPGSLYFQTRPKPGLGLLGYLFEAIT